MPMRLIIMGPPGVGKGTQAELIRKTFHLYHLSTGDMLRETIQKGLPLGQKVKRYLNSGELVPDEIVGEMIEEKLREDQTRKRFLLDGFPRTERQVNILDQVLTRIGEDIDVAFLIHMDEEEIVQRLTGRRVCSHCGALYHLKHKPPQKEGHCDTCHGTLIQREDDKEDVIRERLAVYRRETLPIMEIFRRRGILIEIDGTGSAEEVFQKIRDHLSQVEG